MLFLLTSESPYELISSETIHGPTKLKAITRFKMSQFDNVTVVQKANVYFDGQVTSRTVNFADGSTKTLGIMLPGEYEFSTDKAELVEITAGKLDVILPNTSDAILIQAGESFNVPAKSTFTVRIHEITDYICSYLGD